MPKYTEEELIRMRKQLEQDNAKLAEEKKQLQQQRSLIMKESEKVAESRRQLSEEQRNVSHVSSNNTNRAGSLIDIEKLSIDKDDFELWYGQFQEFLVINEISQEKEVSLFIMKIGNEGYKLLRNLCAISSKRENIRRVSDVN